MKRRIPKSLTDQAHDLRGNATPQERALWRLLSRYRPKFTRQLSIPPFVADLACREARRMKSSLLLAFQGPMLP